jgi:parvulin-like peptidyl-prolyl isomerase
MLMQKIRDNAAWVVGIAVVCFGALIFVDWGMSPGNGMTHKTVVGTVGGDDIRIEEFDQIVQQRAKAQTDQGKELNSEAYAALRREVFADILREKLLSKVFDKYNLQGTPEQVLDFIRRNPPPGAEKAPIFMGADSQFNQALYERWLANPKTFDDRFMQMVEHQTSDKTIPEQSLGRILVSGQAKTTLEKQFEARQERERAWGVAVAASVDSFPVPQPSEADLRKEFETLADSFWIGKPLAKIQAAYFSKMPSAADTLRARQDADTVAARAHRGEKFEDLAQQFSEDQGSAKNGGSLGGLQTRDRWVPAFSLTAAKLEKGQISEPVLSPFGYHVIRCVDRVVKPRTAPLTGSDTLYDLQHVLITITISPETVDSLKQKLDDIRAKVKAGTKFADASRAVQAAVDSVIVSEGDIGHSSTGEVPGASAWAFRGQDNETSEILENTKSLMVLAKPKIVKPGRDFDLARQAVARHLERMERMRKAKDYLQANFAKIQACDTSATCLAQIGKLSATPLVERPASSWIAGLGYAPSGLFGLWNPAAKTPKTWVGPGFDDHGAIVLRIDSLHVPSDADLSQGVAEQQRGEGFAARQGIDEWLASRRREAKVKNNLDQFFRD